MKKKILTLQFRHETNSFCPIPANELAFHNCRFLVGQDAVNSLRDYGIEIGAFIKHFEGRPDIELVHSVALYATPCGHVSEDIYDFVVNEITKTIQEQGPFDGILCDVHGAMVADGHSDGEGDLFEIIRSQVGWDIPLIAPLDLHANVTEKMARHANALFPYEEYPHTDIYETGLLAARAMEQTLDGKLTPTMAYRRIPFLLPLFPSEFPEIKPLYDLAKELEQRSGAISVRFTHGFFPADIAEMGMAVLVVTNGDKELAESLADEMSTAITDNLPNLKRHYPSLDEALDIALEPGDGPIAIGDASDNPGAGGVGDTTHILRRILERGITGAAVASILDPESVKACIKAGVGSTVELSLGGWSDKLYSGGPLHVTAYVKSISDGKFIYKGKMTTGAVANHGTTAVVEIAGNTVLITSLSRQPYDLEIFRSNGVAPEDYRILVTKSAIHYMASYGTIARELITLSLPGYSVPVPEGYAYKNWNTN